ncbi:toll/interleukin-1 receptor domain-containing protein [Clostridium tertium]|uniref:toll/interleukin-1 receptor domain-containing protein n=1 Tax=Clostridium tertium TaxID=1559 RepID=UPI0024B39327|nr:toll/interleukin-1 receptor domain-containing protein [Clostridium tertium]MDI9216431.1 toll/interleukin-1 receptor domain-containing protein [Clostridium tertium]
MKWDLFISHASEDKEEFVIPLVEALTSYGVNVWFDKTELKIGDSLSKKIDEGLIKSNYGLIVISKDFMKKGWTDYELKSLLNKEIGNKKVMLPIWHNVTKKDIEEFSLYLLDKFAINSSNQKINDIAINIIEVVRPDIYKIITNISMTKRLYENSETIEMEVRDIEKLIEHVDKTKIKRHEELAMDTQIIIKAIHEIFKDVTKEKYEDILNIYKYNTNPHKEALVELKNAIIYHRCTHKCGYSLKKRKDIYRLIQGISLFGDKFATSQIFKYLGKEDIKKIEDIYYKFEPNNSDINSTILFTLEDKE